MTIWLLSIILFSVGKAKSILGVSSIIVGSIVGAGFATGQEIVHFFGGLGAYIFLIAPICAVLFSLFCMLFLFLGRLYAPHDISFLHKQCFKRAGFVADLLILLNCAVVAGGMLAAINTLANMVFIDLSLPILSIIAAIVAGAILLNGAKGLSRCSFIIAPIIFVLMAAICFVVIFNNAAPVEGRATTLSFVLALLYAATNMLITGGTIATIGQKDNKSIVLGSILAGAVIGILILLAYFATALGANKGDEMPLLAAVKNVSTALYWLFLVLMLLGVFSTLLSATFNISLWLEPLVKTKFWAVCITLLIAFVVSLFGFANIVEYFYTAFGVFGIVYIAVCAFSLKRKPAVD